MEYTVGATAVPAIVWASYRLLRWLTFLGTAMWISKTRGEEGLHAFARAVEAFRGVPGLRSIAKRDPRGG